MGKVAFIFALLACSSHAHRVFWAQVTSTPMPPLEDSQPTNPLGQLARVLAAFSSSKPGSHVGFRPVSSFSTQPCAVYSQQAVAIDGRRVQRRGEPSAAVTNAAAKPMQSALFMALKKKLGLAVSLEFDPASSGASSVKDLLHTVAYSSMQMRKNKAAAVFTPDLESLASLAKEQEMAKGEYPGPCPVVFSGDGSMAAAAVEAGASAIVLEPKDLEQANTLGVHVLWHVSSADEVGQIMDAGHGDAFFVSASDALEIMPAIPKDALLVAYLDAMQEESAEVDKGRELASAGCNSLLVRQACIGDSEDIAYSKYIIGSLKSKANPNLIGGVLTGAVNGHFDVGAHWMSSGPNWQRTAGRGNSTNAPEANGQAVSNQRQG